LKRENWNKTSRGRFRPHPALGKNGPFFEFSYVCPEPVLVKRSFLYINGSKRPFLLTCLDRRCVKVAVDDVVAWRLQQEKDTFLE
jgi:hypothetical protein